MYIVQSYYTHVERKCCIMYLAYPTYTLYKKHLYPCSYKINPYLICNIRYVQNII